MPGCCSKDSNCYRWKRRGGFAIQAKRLGNAADVIGVDLDEHPLQLARDNAARLGAGGVAFVAGDYRAQSVEVSISADQAHDPASANLAIGRSISDALVEIVRGLAVQGVEVARTPVTVAGFSVQPAAEFQGEAPPQSG